jgi:thiol:disulfide interchange protein DsbC
MGDTAAAQEAVIRSTLGQRIPDLPRIDEVSKTQIPGVYEVRAGSDLFYCDERGDHVIRG